MPEPTDPTEPIEPTKEQLVEALPGTVDTERLSFVGRRGDPSRHLGRAALEAGLAALRAPLDEGAVALMVARGPAGERNLPAEAVLTVEGGMPGDRWAAQTKYGPDY